MPVSLPRPELLGVIYTALRLLLLFVLVAGRFTSASALLLLLLEGFRIFQSHLDPWGAVIVTATLLLYIFGSGPYRLFLRSRPRLASESAGVKKLKGLFWLPVPLLLYWAFKDIRFRELLTTLSRLTPLQIAVLLALNLVFVLIITLRWAIILRGLGVPVGIFKLVSYRLAGFAISYLTPGPQFGGEPLQLYLAKKRSRLSYDLGSASIVLDKTFELLGNFAFLGLATLAILPRGLLSSSGLRLAIPLPSLLIAAPAAYLTAVFFGVRPLSLIAARLPARLLSQPWFQRLKTLIGNSESRIVTYCRRSGRTVLQVLVFFVLVWTVSLVEMRLILHFLGVSADLQQTLFVLAGGKFAFLLPFPGALGALELTQVTVFELLGYAGETALSLVLYMRARDLLFAAAGLIFALSARRQGKMVNS
jgi:uncharacterized protein (TIRG00374 family)